MSIAALNEARETDAADRFRQCCTSENWIAGMVADRPYADAQQLGTMADQHWDKLQEADYLQAFEGHPKIGDVSSLKAKYANTKELAAGEQSGVNDASDEVIRKLAEGNEAYFNKFGFIFIVCATGKSAAQMCDLLYARLDNDRDTEIRIASEEQRKIIHIRIEKLL